MGGGGGSTKSGDWWVGSFSDLRNIPFSRIAYCLLLTPLSRRTQRDRNPSQPLPPAPLAAISADEAARAFLGAQGTPPERGPSPAVGSEQAPSLSPNPRTPFHGILVMWREGDQPDLFAQPAAGPAFPPPTDLLVKRRGEGGSPGWSSQRLFWQPKVGPPSPPPGPPSISID